MLLTLLFVTLSLFGENYFLPYTAIPDGPDAGLINPAGLAAQKGFTFRFDITNTDSAVKSYGDFFLRTGGLSGGGSWGNKGREYHFSYGDRVLSAYRLMAGATYRNSEGENHIDLGFLSRPFKWISLGAAINDIFSTEDQYDPSYRFGAAIRPFAGNERFTLCAGAMYEKDMEKDSVPFSAGAVLEPVKGLRLSAFYDSDEKISFGIETSFGNTTIGTSQYLDQDERFSGGCSYFRFDSRNQYSVVPAPASNLELNLGREYPEDPVSFLFIMPKKERFWNLVESLRKGLEGKAPACLVLKLDNYTLNIAQTEEIISLVSLYRLKGTRIIAYARNFDDLSYYMASASDLIYAYPQGFLQIDGFGATFPFIARGLEKYRITADVEYIGEYKSAGEILVNERMSDHYREQYAEILGDASFRYQNSIASSRNLSLDSVECLIGKSFFNARNALEAGLIDGILYEDEFERMIKEDFGGRFTDAARIAKTEYRDDSWEYKPRIALIIADGTIQTGESGLNPIPLIGGKVLGSETLVRTIRAARLDREIKAVVMRVNSPGGDGLASDLIWREVHLCALEKPFIISMGNVAGSGGYYISCGATRIFCDAGTLTGSIGVVSVKFAFGEMLENLGITFDTLTVSENALMWSGVFPMTEEQKEMHRAEIRAFYEDFVLKVATERGVPYDSLNIIARGRVWSGQDAVDIGLADEIGGIDDAMIYAAKAAGKEDWLQTEVVINPGCGSFGVMDIGSALSFFRFDVKTVVGSNSPVLYYDESLDGIDIR
ncbi:S49 family peptidase [candidate division WOR-3 bacterium]|nr:S49 family peptidase [candidate division WOR-3 bacterium]